MSEKGRSAGESACIWRSGIVLYGAGAVILILVLLVLVATTVSTAPPPTQPVGAGPRGDGPPPIQEILRQGSDRAACQNVLDQLNAWLAEHPERQPAPVEAAVWQRLRLGEEEASFAASPAFTLLDGHYLELALLLDDAARSLDVDRRPASERARAALDWVCRQVRLRETPADPLPPQLVLRRGWGSSRERAMVFCSLVERLGLAGCLVDCPILPAGGRRFWLAGVLADGQVYLFEPRLGVPLWNAAGQVATLHELRQHADLVHQFDLGGKQAYDVTAEQAAGATLHPAGFLSALAPRMQLVQELVGSHPARLARDPRRLAGEFEPLGGEGFRNFTVVPQRFHTPELGGVDQPDREGLTRQRRFELSLVDGRAFPPLLASLPAHSLYGQRFVAAYERPFLNFYLNPRSPRELMLRGRLDEASAGLVETIERLQTVLSRPAPEGAVRQWLATAGPAEHQLLTLHQQKAAPAELEAAAARFEKLWQDSGPAQFLVQAAAGAALAGPADYFLALTKHEQAERGGDARAAWQLAADRWQKHRQDFPDTYPEARLHHARALAMLGQTDAARALLQDPPATLDHWNRHAFLIRARQLK